MNIDTGLRFMSYPILLGPRCIDHKMADKFVLTQLDRFVRKHFPALAEFAASEDGILVHGAVPLKENLK